MIKFFRKIRYDLMEQNKTAKYFKYAIGEIILVVIGILIALQINNWNEDRKNRIEEIALLEQLQSEFQSNLEQLNQKIGMRDGMIHASLKLLNYVDFPQKRDTDSILKYLNITTLAPTFDPVVNDLSSSGRIQLLRSKHLKELLSRWTSEIVQVTEEEIVWKDYTNGTYYSYLLEYSSLRTVFNQYWKNNLMEGFYLDEGTVVEFDLKNSKTNTDMSKLFSDSKFEDHIAFCATMSKIANTQSISLKKRITEILQLIETQLENQND